MRLSLEREVWGSNLELVDSGLRFKSRVSRFRFEVQISSSNLELVNLELGINNFGERGHKNFITWNSRMWTKKKKGLHLGNSTNFHEFWGADQKKSLHLENCANFHKFLVNDQKKNKKKTGFISKIAQIFMTSEVMTRTKKKVFFAKSAKKQFLLTNSRVITSILGISDLELLSNGT